MLHKLVSLLDDNRIQRLMVIQNALIEFVCHPDNPLCDAEESDLRQRIVETCPDAATATWIGRTSSLQNKLKPIAEYLNRNPSRRSVVRQAYIHDFTFHEHLDDNDFVFSFFVLDGELQGLIKQLMVYLYEHLGGGGYSKSLMDDGFPLSRGDYLKLWEMRNPSLHVCPTCDGKQPDIRNGKRLSDLDHFLPKSIYPFLALHPRNLMSICIECNERIKGDTDPLNHEGIVSLSNSFHPYTSVSAVELIAVTCESDINGMIHVKIHDLEQPQSPRIISLNRVYALEDRWTGRLKEVEESLREKVSEWIYSFIDKNEADETIEMKIRDAIEVSKEKVNIGSQPNRIIYRSYLSFVLSDGDELTLILADYLRVMK